ncbi:EamA family transporter [Embleya sp. NPDC050154]|uniref:EamA family transporter n=1 Tax=unclassified Embleya TaxID=2699296 RepID=UPI0037B79CC2
MTRTDSLWAALVSVIWGVNFVAIDASLDDFPPFLLAALRFTLVAFPAVLFIKRPKTSWWLIIGVGLTVNVGQFAFLFSAMHAGMPAGLSSVVIQCQAMFTVLFAVVMLREIPGRTRLISLAVAALGMGVIAFGRGQGASLWPFVLVIGAGASWGFGNMLTRKAGIPGGTGLVVWSALAAPLPLLALSLTVEGPGRDLDALTSASWSGVGGLAFTVVLSSWLGYGLWFALLGRRSASAVAPYGLLVPIVGIVTAWAILGERPGRLESLGAAIVLIGIGLATFTGTPKPPPTTPTASSTNLPLPPLPLEATGGTRT